MFFEPNGRSANNSWMDLRITRSRAASWEPSNPRDLIPNCFSRRVPDSLGSNSAILRLPAPKSRHKNDFVLNIQTAPTVLRKKRYASANPKVERCDVKVFAGY